MRIGAERFRTHRLLLREREEDEREPRERDRERDDFDRERERERDREPLRAGLGEREPFLTLVNCRRHGVDETRSWKSWGIGFRDHRARL